MQCIDIQIYQADAGGYTTYDIVIVGINTVEAKIVQREEVKIQIQRCEIVRSEKVQSE